MNQSHVILLKKNLEPISVKSNTWIKKAHTRWISLGHFDEIFIYEIANNSDFLGAIAVDKTFVASHSDASAYYHPIYLMLDTDRAHSDHDNQWYIAVVRIHFSLSQQLTKQFERLRNGINDELEMSDISYKVYHATEFSDMVLDVRSRHFRNLLNFVLKLRKYKEVGKMYTYFGINTCFLEAKDLSAEIGDEIPLFAMRFSGTDISVVNQQVKIVKAALPKEREYSVNGVDDVMLVYRDIPLTSIVDLYREWLFCDSNQMIRHSESVTRVGIHISVEDDFTIPPKTDMLPLTKNLLSLCDQIAARMIQNKEENLDSWVSSVFKIAHSLVRMSKTPVMDEVVYLLAPQTEAFLVNLLAMLDDGISQEDLTLYHYYIESCTFIMEQLIRIEGQLSQQPEIRPIVYDIPVFMLEYTVAFLNEVSNLLQMNDSNHNKHHVFLLVPRPCQQISAVELYRATPTLPGLVHLQVPEQSLYKPTVILRALCHEISHYVGEKYRNRAYRKIYYSRAVAAILVDAVFQSKAHSIVQFFENYFRTRISISSEPTIREMHTAIGMAIEDIFSTEESLASIVKEYLNTSNKPDRINFPHQDTIYRGLQRFNRHCEDLDTLFREIYADVCMLYLLDIQTDDYIESLLEELSINADPIYICNELFAIRIYISLSVTKKMVAYERNRYRDVWAQIRTIIKQIHDEIYEETDGRFKLPLPISAIYALLKYAQRCYDTISRSVNTEHTMKIRDMFSSFTQNEFTYETLLYKIEECRTNMIAFSSGN